MGIGGLVLLQSLAYSVGTEEGNGIAELGKLDLLENLKIHGFENVRWLTDAKTANLKGKQNLRDLELRWGHTQVRYDSHTIGLLEVLQPPTGLRKLDVGFYEGDVFPTWMCIPSCLPNLESLVLAFCPLLQKLPAAIGQLPSLRSLSLAGMVILSLDIEFPWLTQLNLSYMDFLEQVCYSYPCLQSLNINYCSRLIKIPLLPSLTKLELCNIDNRLVSLIERSYTSVTHLSIKNVEWFQFLSLSILQNNRNLQNLSIEGCNHFQGFRVNDDRNDNEGALFGTQIQHDSIQTFVLNGCPVLKFLPDLRGWTSLQDLAFYKCPQVKEYLTYDLKSLSSLQSFESRFH